MAPKILRPLSLFAFKPKLREIIRVQFWGSNSTQLWVIALLAFGAGKVQFWGLNFVSSNRPNVVPARFFRPNSGAGIRSSFGAGFRPNFGVEIWPNFWAGIWFHFGAGIRPQNRRPRMFAS